MDTISMNEWIKMAADGSVEVYDRMLTVDGLVVWGYVPSSTACGGKRHVMIRVLGT